MELSQNVRPNKARQMFVVSRTKHLTSMLMHKQSRKPKGLFHPPVVVVVVVVVHLTHILTCLQCLLSSAYCPFLCPKMMCHLLRWGSCRVLPFPLMWPLLRWMCLSLPLTKAVWMMRPATWAPPLRALAVVAVPAVAVVAATLVPTLKNAPLLRSRRLLRRVLAPPSCLIYCVTTTSNPR